MNATIGGAIGDDDLRNDCGAIGDDQTFRVFTRCPLIRNAHNDLIFIGDAISARDPKLIYDHEFAAVVDLAANEPPAVLGRDIVYCRFPLSDDGSNDDAIVSAAIECLCSLIQRDVRTLVACSAGMSRSPMIAAAALSIVHRDSLADVLGKMTANGPRDVSPTFFASVQRVRDRLIR